MTFPNFDSMRRYPLNTEIIQSIVTPNLMITEVGPVAREGVYIRGFPLRSDKFRCLPERMHFGIETYGFYHPMKRRPQYAR